MLLSRLLAALPPADFSRLTAPMTNVTLGHKDVLYPTGSLIDNVYFPRSGILSSGVFRLDGQTTSVARGWSG